jgi:HPt (histidine-containing phosphotransfer) domain-containing protein
MNIDQVMHTFIAESRELLEQMENALLAVAHDGPDAVNAIFRAAHTIKGSAGMFGLDPVVDFTHVAESVLDKVRDGHVPVTDELVALLLACCDHIGALVDAVDSGTLDSDTGAHRSRRAAGRRAAGYLDGTAHRLAAAAAQRRRRRQRRHAGMGHLAALRRGRAAQRHGPAVLHPLPRPTGQHHPHRTAGRPPAGRRRIRSRILLPRLRDRLCQQRKPGHDRRRVRLRARRLRDPHRAGGGRARAGGSSACRARARPRSARHRKPGRSRKSARSASTPTSWTA